MKIKIIENGRVIVAQQLVKTDLSGCLVPDCFICKCSVPGASHSKSGVPYHVKCKLCEDNGIKSLYDGESGDNLI